MIDRLVTVPLFLAMSAAACSQNVTEASFASLESASAYVWLDRNKNKRVCISGKIKGTMGSLAFRYAPRPSEDVGVYSSIIYTDITEGFAFKNNIKVGDNATICGFLKIEPDVGNSIDSRLDERNYKLFNSSVR